MEVYRNPLMYEESLMKFQVFRLLLTSEVNKSNAFC